MASLNETEREDLLDVWLDEWLSSVGAGTSGDTPFVPAPDDDELRELAEVATDVRAYVTSSSLTPVIPALHPRRLSRGTLLRVAAVVLLLAGAAVGVAIARSEPAAKTAPASHLRLTAAMARCPGAVKAVEHDGAKLPHGLLVNLENNLRAAGDPCPTAPLLWSSGPAKKAGSAAGGVGYLVEASGRFYENPLTFSHPTSRQRIFSSRGGLVYFGATAPYSLRQLGQVHRLWLKPVPAQPQLPARFVDEISASLRAAGVSWPTRPVSWASFPLGRQPSVSMSAFPGVHASRASSVILATVTVQVRSGPGGGLLTRAFADFVEPNGASEVFYPRAPLGTVERLLGSSQTHTEWLPVVVPSRMPSWIEREVTSEARGNPHPSRLAAWVATTAGAVRAADPYGLGVQPGIPAVTPVWIASFGGHGNQASWWFVSTADPGSRYIFLSNVQQSTPGYGGHPLSYFGTVRHVRVPSYVAPPEGSGSTSTSQGH